MAPPQLIWGGAATTPGRLRTFTLLSDSVSIPRAATKYSSAPCAPTVSFRATPLLEYIFHTILTLNQFVRVTSFFQQPLSELYGGLISFEDSQSTAQF
jgi:hypothetical protein